MKRFLRCSVVSIFLAASFLGVSSPAQAATGSWSSVNSGKPGVACWGTWNSQPGGSVIVSGTIKDTAADNRFALCLFRYTTTTEIGWTNISTQGHGAGYSRTFSFTVPYARSINVTECLGTTITRSCGVAVRVWP
jgi:hypothetical protein